MTVSLVMVVALIALIPANIASRKGASFIGWWIFGTLFLVVALPMALMMKGRRCPFCAETVQPKASVCPHCQRDIPTA